MTDRLDILTAALRCTVSRTAGMDALAIFNEELTRATAEADTGFGQPVDEGFPLAAAPYLRLLRADVAERHVLGALLQDGGNSAVNVLKLYLGETHFADQAHALIYRTMIKLAEAGEAVTPQSVYARAGKQLDDADLGGGMAYLGQLAAESRLGVSLEHTAQAIRTSYQRRCLVEIGTRMQAVGAALTDDAQDPEQAAISLLHNLGFTLETLIRELRAAHTADGMERPVTLRPSCEPEMPF